MQGVKCPLCIGIDLGSIVASVVSYCEPGLKVLWRRIQMVDFSNRFTAHLVLISQVYCPEELKKPAVKRSNV